MYPDSDRIKHFKASKREAAYYGLSNDHRYVEIRYDDYQEDADQTQWTVDEIVTPGIHLEGMDQDAVWMNVKGVHVWFRAIRVKGDRRPHLIVTCFADDAKPVVVTEGQP